MDRYEIRTSTWSSGLIRVASSRRHRRLGLTRTTGSVGLALKARSIHTFGMTRSISVIACDHKARVLRAKRLRPRRLFFARGAVLIFETLSLELPTVGEAVQVFRMRRGAGTLNPEPGA